MIKNPWMKFYPQDWQGDEGLQMASLPARGLWIECLCIMHSADGFLRVGKTAVTDELLARKVGTSVDQVRALLVELETLNVFSRSRGGEIYSRRMVEDQKTARKNAENGKNGGASKHKKRKGNLNLGNPNSSETQATPLGPDTRSQIPERKKEKINQKENAGDDPPAKHWWAGDVIKLNRKDYEEMFALYRGSDEQFMGYLDSRDRWYAGQPPEKGRGWFLATFNDLRRLASI